MELAWVLGAFGTNTSCPLALGFHPRASAWAVQGVGGVASKSTWHQQVLGSAQHHLCRARSILSVLGAFGTNT